MLSPIYRRCGIELTRITAGHQRYAEAQHTPLQWMVELKKEAPRVMNQCWKMYRIRPDPDLEDVGLFAHAGPAFTNAPSYFRHLKLNADFEALIHGGDVEKNAEATILRAATCRVVEDLADREEANILLDARRRFRGLYHPKLNVMNVTTKPHHRFWKLGIDPCCIEFSSAPMTDWAHFEEFFTLADDFLDEKGCLRTSDLIAGTGGHIHVAMDPKHVFKVRRHLLNHPWVMFAFADPRDYAQNLENAPYETFHRKGNRLPWNPLYRRWRERLNPAPSPNFYQRNTWYSDKSPMPVAFRENEHFVSEGNYCTTAEWRMFDIAQTWEMQEEHLAFAQAFSEYAIRAPKPEKLMSYEEVKELSFEAMVDGFRSTLKTLKLPWRRYKWYAENNIATRMELNTPSYQTEQNASYSLGYFRSHEPKHCRAKPSPTPALPVKLDNERADVITLTHDPRGVVQADGSTSPSISLIAQMAHLRAERDGLFTISIRGEPVQGELDVTHETQPLKSVPDLTDEGGVLRHPHAEPSGTTCEGPSSPDVRRAQEPASGGEAHRATDIAAAGSAEINPLPGDRDIPGRRRYLGP